MKTLFIKELLEFVTSKLSKNIKKIKGDSVLLLHYALEIMRFDDLLRNRHIYHPDRTSIEPWSGCISLLTDNIEYLQLWCRFEIQGTYAPPVYMEEYEDGSGSNQ